MSSNFNMDWNSIKEPGKGGNVDFLKLKDGINQMRIVSTPAQISIHWEKGIDGQNKKVICPGSGCPICKAGKAPQLRYQIQVIDRTDGKVKVLEQGSTVFNAIKAYAVDPEYGDPSKYDIKIKKEGSGRDTKYSVVASPNKSELNSDEQKAVQECKSLEEINKPKTCDEIIQMGLEVLLDSVSDLEDFGGDTPNSFDESNDDDWDNL